VQSNLSAFVDQARGGWSDRASMGKARSLMTLLLLGLPELIY